MHIEIFHGRAWAWPSWDIQYCRVPINIICTLAVCTSLTAGFVISRGENSIGSSNSTGWDVVMLTIRSL